MFLQLVSGSVSNDLVKPDKWDYWDISVQFEANEAFPLEQMLDLVVQFSISWLYQSTTS